MAIALVGQIVDRLDAILDERLRRVRQLSRRRRRTHDREHVRMLRDQLDGRVRELDAQLVERAVRQNRRQAADVRQIFVELLRARLLQRDSADADVVLRRPIEAEAGLEAMAFVDLVRPLRQQLVVVERPRHVAGRGRRRNGGDRHAARALVGDEVVRAVALNRTAEPAPALLLLERRASGREEVARVQRFVAVEVVGAAVQIVCPGSGDGIEDHAGRIPELCLVLIGQDLELLDGVRRRVRSNGVVAIISVLTPSTSVSPLPRG